MVNIMVRSDPLISVIIPTYNHGQFIEEAIKSVLGQTYREFELIVVDDGSTDNTNQVLRKYGKDIVHIYQRNSGVSSARNRGISVAKGEFIAFLDSDDVWMPEKLEMQLALAQENNSIGLVGCAGYHIDSTGRIEREFIAGSPEDHSEFLEHLLIRNIFPGGSSGAFARKECFERVGLFDERLRFGEDWDMWIRISKAYSVKFAQQPLMKLRRHNLIKAYKNIKTIESNIRMVINKNVEFHKKIIKRKANSWMYTDMAMFCLSENKKLRSLFYIIKALRSYPFKIFPEDRKIRLLVRSMTPDILYQEIRAPKRMD
jgi:glycosyltransferase involved in cell wall biosynthesis